MKPLLLPLKLQLLPLRLAGPHFQLLGFLFDSLFQRPRERRWLSAYVGERGQEGESFSSRNALYLHGLSGLWAFFYSLVWGTQEDVGVYEDKEWNVFDPRVQLFLVRISCALGRKCRKAHSSIQRNQTVENMIAFVMPCVSRSSPKHALFDTTQSNCGKHGSIRYGSFLSFFSFAVC